MEIERKFLINEDINDKGVYNIEEIEQGYISFKPEVRIRNVSNREYFLTYKSEGKCVRNEVEVRITKAQYDILFNTIKGRVIKKTRFYIMLDNNKTAEVDSYAGVLDGLVVAETEFKSLDEATAFVPPTWYGVEITDDKRFKNKYLAKAHDDDITKLITKTIPKKNAKALKR